MAERTIQSFCRGLNSHRLLRLAEVKKASGCSNGSFVDFQNRLLNGKKAKNDCPACNHLLTRSGFCTSDLDIHLDKALNGEEDPFIPVDTPGTQPEATRDQADQSEAEEETPEDWLMKFDFLEVLQPGDYGRKAPVRCKLCTSRKQPNGKVLEVHVMKIKSVKHFLGQHFSSSSHQKNLAIHEGRDALDQGLRVKCPGIDVDDKDCAGHLYTYREEFKLWVQMSNLKELAKHSYSFDASKGTWRARASSCEEQFESQSPEDVVCKECLKLGAAHSIARHVVKFSIKYYLANLLSCRIFQGAEAVEELLAKIKANPIYLRDPPYMENLLALKTNKLQQYVRASWLSTPLTGANQALISFVNSIVKPALNVCVHSVPENFVDVIGRLTACIASGESGESTIGTMKMASAILKGDLENHPLLHGITLQCLRRIDKEKRGITTMAGRRSTESQMEADLIADAGLSLSLAGGNKQLAKQLLSAIFIHIQSILIHIHIQIH